MALQEWIERYPAVKALLDRQEVRLEYTPDVAGDLVIVPVSPSTDACMDKPGRGKESSAISGLFPSSESYVIRASLTLNMNGLGACLVYQLLERDIEITSGRGLSPEDVAALVHDLVRMSADVRP